MSEETFKYKSETFDGPLDLLLSLIQKNKVSIYDIPIAEILDQYVDYMEEMRSENIQIAAEFIVMAAELIYIKSKMLLPREEEEADPREGLVNALVEYQKIKVAAAFLGERMEFFFARFNSKPMPTVVTRVTPNGDPNELYEIMEYLRTVRKDKKESDKRASIGTILSVPVVSIEEKIVYVLRVLVRSLRFEKPVSFRVLFSNNRGKSDKVACFLAVLELVKSGRISVSHDGDDDYRVVLNREKKTEEPSFNISETQNSN